MVSSDYGEDDSGCEEYVVKVMVLGKGVVVVMTLVVKKKVSVVTVVKCSGGDCTLR